RAPKIADTIRQGNGYVRRPPEKIQRAAIGENGSAYVGGRPGDRHRAIEKELAGVVRLRDRAGVGVHRRYYVSPRSQVLATGHPSRAKSPRTRQSELRGV